jgi:hypothetical protein
MEAMGRSSTRYWSLAVFIAVCAVGATGCGSSENTLPNTTSPARSSTGVSELTTTTTTAATPSSSSSGASGGGTDWLAVVCADGPQGPVIGEAHPFRDENARASILQNLGAAAIDDLWPGVTENDFEQVLTDANVRVVISPDPSGALEEVDGMRVNTPDETAMLESPVQPSDEVYWEIPCETS